MSDLSDLVPIPPSINGGLSACRENTMLNLYGRPGNLTAQCSSITGDIKSRMAYGINVGPFKVSGLDYAVESLSLALREVSSISPDAYSQLKTAGMLCVRCIKHNPAHYSNHSWGTAIDLYFGIGVVPQSKPLTQRGFIYIYEIFRKHGWYWGAGFSGSSVDSMHFELADETVRGIPVDGISQDMLVSAADYMEQVGYNNDLEDA